MSIIEIKDFSKSYGKFLAVNSLNLEIEEGEIVGFVGKNGAGKSTTIRCMMNILFPSKGSIIIDGLDSAKDAKELRSIISYMPSETEFRESITSYELFKFCSRFTENGLDRAMELAKYFELDTSKKVGALSLGNRKKVSIIQALIKDAKLIILDEPTSGLDPLMQEKFFTRILQEKKNGTTIFLSSHNLAEVERYCDKVAIIKDGELVDYLNMKNVHVNRQKMVSYTLKNGEVKSYIFDDNINDLVKELSRLELTSLEIKNASVEDEFIKYYKEDGDE
jgi:ABC-2 type transport system ATP-binding protein